MRPTMALLAAAALGAAACGEGSEQERLDKRLGSVEVRVYRTGRDALARSAADPRAGKGRDALGKLFTRAPDAEAAERLASGRSALEALSSGDPASGTGDPPPLLPAVVGLVQPGAALDPRFGRDEEHVVVGSVLWVLHAHPDAPHLPVADTLALWEAMSISEAGLSRSPLRRPARALRTLTLGQARLCGMSEREDAALRQGAPDEGLADGLVLLGLGGATPAQVHALGLSLRALAAAQVAECFLDEHEVERAAPALAALCEDARALGLDARQLGDVCHGKPDAAAIGRLARTLVTRRTGLEEKLRALPVVEAARRFATGGT